MKHAFTVALFCLLTPCFVFSQTVLRPGDMAVVTMNADNPDVWAVVTFVDLTPGTQILFTDNGYERDAPNNVATGTFGNSEEVLQLEVTGSTIPAGTVITYDGSAAAPYTTPSNFIHTMVANNLFASAPFRFNQFTASGDCIFIMQGTWNNGTIPGTSHDATFTGTLIWGHNARPWEPLAGACGASNCSRLPPVLECLNNEFPHFDNYGYLNTAPKTGSLGSLISSIRNPANWGMNNSTLFTPPTGPFVVTSGLNESTWTGDVDTDWFNCANWDNLRVPDQTIDAVFPVQSSSNNIVLQPGDSAHCRDFTLNDGTGNVFFAENDPSKVLYVHGDLNINTDPGSLALDFDDGSFGTPDGELYLYGDWNNNSDEGDFREGDSKVRMVGSVAQAINTTGGQNELFGDLVVNKTAGNLTLNANIEVSGQLDLTAGLINGNSFSTSVTNQQPSSVINHSNTSYVAGTLIREIQTGAGTPSYDFPIGTLTNYELATFDFTNPGGFSTIEGSFSPLITGAAPNITEATFLYDELLDGGIWNFSPNGTFSGSYSVTLNETGYTNGLANRYINVKRPNSAFPWNNPGTHNTFSEAGGIVTCTRDGLTAFSEFAIALNRLVLPVNLESFTGHLLENGHAILSWKTSEELANKGYRLEHRQNQTQFEPLAWLNSNNERSGSEYSFEHPEIPFGTNYYRLIQIDLNGTENDLGTVEVFRDPSGQLSISAFPNPYLGSELAINVQGEGTMFAKVVSMDGKVLGTFQGEALQTGAELARILRNVAPGSYYIHLRNPASNLHLKLIKID